MSKTSSLVESVRAGERTVVVSLCHGPREVEYSRCDFTAAAELLARKTVNDYRYSVPDWQWAESGVTLAEIEELESALRDQV